MTTQKGIAELILIVTFAIAVAITGLVIISKRQTPLTPTERQKQSQQNKQNITQSEDYGANQPFYNKDGITLTHT